MEKIILENGTMIKPTKLLGCYIVEPNVNNQDYGYFVETYREDSFQRGGIYYHFVQQIEFTIQKKNTISGLHFQISPYTQAKLIRCTNGVIDDVVVDLRKGSPTYKKWLRIELSRKNHRELLVPEGFANGLITRCDDTTIACSVSHKYSEQQSAGIIWNDSELGIDWNIPKGVEPIVSEKEAQYPKLVKSKAYFIYKNVF